MVKCTPFASNLYYLSMLGSESVLGIRIRIHKAPEYGSGSTTLVTRDTDTRAGLWIRIHFLPIRPFHSMRIRIQCFSFFLKRKKSKLCKWKFYEIQREKYLGKNKYLNNRINQLKTNFTTILGSTPFLRPFEVLCRMFGRLATVSLAHLKVVVNEDTIADVWRSVIRFRRTSSPSQPGGLILILITHTYSILSDGHSRLFCAFTILL